MKEEDEDENGAAGESLMGQGRRISKSSRQAILRKLSLALAIYGLFVMILCLGTNLFFTGGGGH